MVIRLFDITFSLSALLFLSPLLLAVMVVLKLSGEGEIFFLQERVGKKSKLFNLFKFATMLKDSPNMATGTVTLKNDPRVLPMGGGLRKTKLNELPQLFNILKGDMSLVGPRPQTKRCFNAFPLSSQAEIIKVRPGLSGIGSIVFRREEEMLNDSDDSEGFYDNVIMPYKGQLEEWYVANNGTRTYFFCIWVTVWIVLFPKSRLVWKIFKGLPDPPDVCVEKIGFE
jgi:lipopolysaccharide/colanic/teichoic acid biosynthesis glycosyltransferase